MRSAALSIVLVACGGAAAAVPVANHPTETRSVQPSPAGPSSSAPRPAAEAIFAKLRPDLVACYEQGKRKVPEMTSGKVTLHASIERDGRTICVVPSDDTGLTQEVEDCLRERLERETHPSSSAAWSYALPLAVRDGALSLGKASAAPLLETVESHGLSEDVYDVMRGELGALQACLATAPAPHVYVGARVGANGRVACSLVSANEPVSAEAQSCVARIFARVAFAPPKRGNGLLSIPVSIGRRR